MATPFSDVFDYFLSNITDYSLLELHNVELEENMKSWLMGAIVNYPNPKSDLFNFDSIDNKFNIDISQGEKIILGKLMAIEYINPFILDETLLKQSLNSKDYRSYSPAKQLETLQKIKNELSNDVSLMISRQSYSVNNIKEWFGKKE
ncbi:hypothetical protein M3649_04165 [Ureibacillus chungkukjangi]|uniref:hypothetical protein n=1 Tax=Ureibacillus chungkukjangi TaxID=1202712 RepID=UPI00203ABE3A|nr:hypothetical protein [Ureibacillus chungkukjangi]MCM3387328.1 hypothetical protein [Ureibacillus chungkukjangi]